MKYKVTIVMPVYGVEKYIEESLKSIIEQNQEKEQLLLVDDGTKDNSIDIAKECLKNTKNSTGNWITAIPTSQEIPA